MSGGCWTERLACGTAAGRPCAGRAWWRGAEDAGGSPGRRRRQVDLPRPPLLDLKAWRGVASGSGRPGPERPGTPKVVHAAPRTWSRPAPSLLSTPNLNPLTLVNPGDHVGRGPAEVPWPLPPHALPWRKKGASVDPMARRSELERPPQAFLPVHPSAAHPARRRGS